jgi:hypothetical protein
MGTDCADPRRGRDSLVFEEIPGQEEDVGGAFCEAAHEVGVPLVAEGDVDADAVALGGEFALEVAADAVEHLEFEGGFLDAAFVDGAAHLLDDGFVVGGHAAEDRACAEVEHEVGVVAVDVRFGGKGNGGGLFVGAFAEADANSLLDEAAGVVDGAEEIGLKDGADAAGKTLVEALCDFEGGLGVVGAFHVDADEAVGLVRVLDHLGDDALGERGVELHAHLRELDADVGVELAGFDCVEKLVIDGGAVLGVGFVEDRLAEGVEGGGDSLSIEGGGGGEGLFDGHAGDETAGEFAADGGSLGELTEALVAGHGDKEGTKQGG